MDAAAGTVQGNRGIAMESKHLCRAKRIDNREWAEGYYVKGLDIKDKEVHVIFEPDTILYSCGETDGFVEVDASTICQCTGLEDKNGKLIFENDIVIKHNDDDKEPYLIRWSENYAAWELAQCGCAMYGFFDVDLGEIEVIGNAIDNPELLEV